MCVISRQWGGAGGRRYPLRPAVYPAGGWRRGGGGCQDASTCSYLTSHWQQRQHSSPPECEYSLLVGWGVSILLWRQDQNINGPPSVSISVPELWECAVTCLLLKTERWATASCHNNTFETPTALNSVNDRASPLQSSQDLVKSLALLESVFMASYPNREGTLPTPKPGGPGLHCAALQAWALLVTLCPPSKLTVLLDQWGKHTHHKQNKNAKPLRIWSPL